MKFVILALGLWATLGGCSSTCKDIRGGMAGDFRPCKNDCLHPTKEKRKTCGCSTMCPCWREH